MKKTLIRDIEIGYGFLLLGSVFAIFINIFSSQIELLLSGNKINITSFFVSIGGMLLFMYLFEKKIKKH